MFCRKMRAKLSAMTSRMPLTLEGPGGVLAGGAAAEVRPADDDLFAGDVPLRVEPGELQALEQIGLKGLPRDFRQVLRRYDFVRVDVRPVEKENASAEILHADISFAIRYAL